MRFFGVFVLVCLVSFNSHALFGKKKKNTPVSEYSKGHTIKTADGCSLNLSDLYINPKNKHSWSGACPSGYAEGIGWVSVQQANGVSYKAFAVQMQRGWVLPGSYWYTSGQTDYYQSTLGTHDCKDKKSNMQQCARIDSFVAANHPYEQILTSDGCKLQQPSLLVFGSQVTWSGKCENGLAEGYGYVRHSAVDGNNAIVGKSAYLLRYHHGKRVVGSYYQWDSEFNGSKSSFVYKVDPALTPMHVETLKPCASIKPCKELMAAKALGGKNPEGMAPVSDFMPPVAGTRGGGDRPPAFDPNPRPNPNAPAQPPVNGGNGASSGGGYGIGKYKAPKVACDDYALGLEMDKHSATINEGVGICDNAKATAKLYEFYANLLEASCPYKTAEVAQVREAVASAKQTIRGSCTDYNY